MDEKDIGEIRKMVANDSYAMSQPIDFEDLIKRGILRKIGKSYYTDDIKLLPRETRVKLKSHAKGRHGMRVTFARESKRMANLAKKYEQFRD